MDNFIGELSIVFNNLPALEPLFASFFRSSSVRFVSPTFIFLFFFFSQNITQFFLFFSSSLGSRESVLSIVCFVKASLRGWSNWICSVSLVTQGVLEICWKYLKKKKSFPRLWFCSAKKIRIREVVEDNWIRPLEIDEKNKGKVRSGISIRFQRNGIWRWKETST